MPKAFDRFWNGDWAVPIEALVERSYTQSDLQNSVSQMRRNIAAGNYPYSLEDDTARMLDTLASIKSKLIWAPGVVVWDDPSTITTEEQPGEILEALHRKVQSLKHQFTIESAYFIVGARGRKAFQEMCDRGIKIRVLTNSLASNDVIPAHAGHVEFRDELLQTCAQIYEVRPDSGLVRNGWEGDSMAGLHSKAMVFDRESVFIGSFNLDPRSAVINTEAGLYVDSPELAEQVLAHMDEAVSPENSYHLRFDKNGNRYWETMTDGVSVRYDDEPESTFRQRLQSDFIELLPVQSQL